MGKEIRHKNGSYILELKIVYHIVRKQEKTTAHNFSKNIFREHNTSLWWIKAMYSIAKDCRLTSQLDI